jgi:hypothetical protein
MEHVKYMFEKLSEVESSEGPREMGRIGNPSGKGLIVLNS